MSECYAGCSVCKRDILARISNLIKTIAAIISKTDGFFASIGNRSQLAARIISIRQYQYTIFIVCFCDFSYLIVTLFAKIGIFKLVGRAGTSNDSLSIIIKSIASISTIKSDNLTAFTLKGSGSTISHNYSFLHIKLIACSNIKRVTAFCPESIIEHKREVYIAVNICKGK